MMRKRSLFVALAISTTTFIEFGSYVESVVCSGSPESTDFGASEMKISAAAYYSTYCQSHFNVA